MADMADSDWMQAAGLDEKARRRVIAAARETGERPVRVIRQLGLARDEILAKSLAEGLKLPLLQAPDFTLDRDRSPALSKSFLQANAICPASRMDDGTLVVAFADPTDDAAQESLALALDAPMQVAVAAQGDIEAAITSMFDSDDMLEPAIGSDAALSSDTEHLRDLASEAPVVRRVNELMAQAARARASDIHIEPFRDHLQIRYRIDGVLHDVDAPPVAQAKLVVSRIKILAGLDIAERRRPQDGRARINVEGIPLDLRIATSPSVHGESVVIRLLEDRDVEVDLTTLGLDKPQLQQLHDRLRDPFGLILVVGPTGGGKTTTLAGAINELNQPGRKVISIEDPVEYQIDGVTQIAVNPAVGLTFASALRSVLRHDPDSIVVGELRDTETAEIAVNAALTGHLVLATLHANTAAAAPARLVDMGVDPSLLRSTLKLVVAQRLVRQLCPTCKGTGCDDCQQTGYHGRTGLFEFLPLDAELLSLIRPGSSAPEMAQAAKAAGLLTFADAAAAKVKAGITDMREVERVLGVAKGNRS